jgi:hypothetical protein
MRLSTKPARGDHHRGHDPRRDGNGQSAPRRRRADRHGNDQAETLLLALPDVADGSAICWWQVCRFCGKRQPVMGVTGDNCSPGGKCGSHGMPHPTRIHSGGFGANTPGWLLVLALR